MAGYIYFKEPEIKGEVTQGAIAIPATTSAPNNKTHPEYYHFWIELNSMSQTVTRAIETGRSGTARARSGTVMEDIEIEKEVDLTTVYLIQHCSAGTAFKEVWIHLCTSISNSPNPDLSLHPYLELRLFSVKITNYSLNGSGLDDGAIPTETLQLNFDKIQWKYWPIGPSAVHAEGDANTIHAPKTTGWDILKQAQFTA
jgi:type VI protein secretion system component Hcp